MNKSKDSFFDSIGNLTGNQEDGMFNILSTPTTKSPVKKNAKSSFFKDFGIEGSDKQ